MNASAPHPPPAAARLLAVLRTPGARPLLASRSVGAMPAGMLPLGIVLLLRAAGRSYAVAGVADGAYALGFATVSPLVARLIDRVGMGRVLAPLAGLFPTVVLALVLVGRHGSSALAAVALALVAGALMPPLGSCMRALWPSLVDGAEMRAAAFALDATLQELAFVGGPPLLAAVAALAGPSAALIVAGAAGGTGSALFALSARRRHVPTRREGGALRSLGVRRVLVMSTLMGGAFGAYEVAMPAFCERHGARPAAGIMLAALALGSACGGAAIGSRGARSAPARRLWSALAAMAVLLSPLLVAPSIGVMAVLSFVAGMPIAPAFAAAFVLLDHFTVPGAITETFAWNTTSIFVGASLGTAAGGALAASSGYSATIVLSTGLALAAAAYVMAASRHGRLDLPSQPVGLLEDH